MTDKGKYASHGTYITKMSQNSASKRNKLQLGIIHPMPSAQPKKKPTFQQDTRMNVNSKKFDAKFKFQEPIQIKPVPSELVQPFIYIQKIIAPKKSAQMATKETLRPFVTSKNVASKNSHAETAISVAGYNNLFEFETDRKNVANSLFSKVLESGNDRIREIFHLWNKDSKRNLTPDININEDEFVDFIRELIPGKISTKRIKHFFQLYQNKASSNKISEGACRTISLRAFAYNYNKYKKAETEITNILSEKAAKNRSKEVKKYLTDFFSGYPELKAAMAGIKEYEEGLRRFFHRIFDDYQNPYEELIKELQEELKKPIIKYDKEKKEAIEREIAKYESQNSDQFSQLSTEFTAFMEAYESAIVKDHDLFFTKRTVAYLLKPIIEKEPVITRGLVQQQVAYKQDEKQRYLEFLSAIVVEIDTDKKNVVEETFTLGDIVQLISMKLRRGSHQPAQQEFMVESMKKLIKQIKRQFLIKNSLVIADIEAFPADQEIPISLLHTCFEMQCTKVLFKNRIWTELLDMIPARSITSHLHQNSIDANTCLQYILKYFRKLDERSRTQMNKSKEIAMLAESACRDNFGKLAQIINTVCDNLDVNVDSDGEPDPPQEKSEKKVAFADVVDAKLAVDRGEHNFLRSPNNDNEIIARNLLKTIHHGEGEKLQENKSHPDQDINSPLQNLSALKTLARSYFQPEAMNTNAFDIRFYEQINEGQKNTEAELNEELVELGNSMLLRNVPRVKEIQGEAVDPLRISRFLLKNIDQEVKSSSNVIREKSYEYDIGEGVSHNYYRDKVQLEKRPTRYDSEGKAKYSVLLPVSYYESYLVHENVPDEEKWHIRPHHVETLTENPLSKKDNVIQTEYQSKLEKLGLKKRPDEFVIEENVKRKEDLISALEDRIQSLKGEVVRAGGRSGQQGGSTVPTSTLNEYYQKITDGKEDKELQLAAYEGVLYDLRKKERQLLNNYRDKQTHEVGEANEKWWQRKDKLFNHELRKDRDLLRDSILNQGRHRQYVEKLKNKEIY